MGASAHNLANAQTDNFKRQEVVQQAQPQAGVQVTLRSAAAPGPALVQDIVEQKSASYAYQANLKVIQTEKQLKGSLLNERA